MYAVIRAGGKQYRVAPGDVIRLENQKDENGNIEFGDVLAVSEGDGLIGAALPDTRVFGQVVEQGRAKKILVFHYKRKKQYKKLRGHRQGYTAVRITEIAHQGKKATAPELSPNRAEPASVVRAAPEKASAATKAPAPKKAAKKSAPAKKAAVKKKK
jgi:large subunit ribosomal protein L21